MTNEIHTAYSVSRKGGLTYRARACVRHADGTRSTLTVSLDDTPELATANAVRYIKEIYAREGLKAPETVIEHGRHPVAGVDNYWFAL